MTSGSEAESESRRGRLGKKESKGINKKGGFKDWMNLGGMWNGRMDDPFFLFLLNSLRQRLFLIFNQITC